MQFGNSRHRKTGNTQIRFEVSKSIESISSMVKNERVRMLDEVSFLAIFSLSLSSTEHRDLENLRCGLMMSGGKSFLLGGEKSLLDFDVIKTEVTRKVW